MMARPATVRLLLLCGLLATLNAVPAGATDFTIEHTSSAFIKTDLEVNPLDVLSGGEASVLASDQLHEIISNDLIYSGLFRIEAGEGQGDTLNFEYTVEGTVEGPLRDAGQTGETAPTTISLNLLTWPGRQLLLNKRYRPLPSQMRSTGHHFANEVIYALTGEPGIAMTRVVFSRSTGDGSDLYAVDYDGEGLLRLTANRELNLCPSWSPDGSEIAFTSYRNHQQGLFILDTSNGKVRAVTAQEGLNFGADWHPDGKELLVSMSRGGNPEIYRISPTGKIIKRLTVAKSIEISPSWAPGGRDLVFTSDRTGTPQLYIIDSDGAGRRRLTFEGRYNDSAVWSPGGDKIAYATREGNITQIVVMKSTGEDRRVVTDSRWRNCEDPSWAPDGRHLVFASDRSGVFKLYVYDDEEGTFRQLTFGDDPDISPAWSK